MTNSQNTKRALLLSVLSMVLCFAMLAGSTFAWFTDSVKSGTNKIVAGNLDVELYHANSKVTTAEKVTETTKLFVDENGEAILWEPGVMTYENFTVKNEGTLALKYKLAMSIGAFNTVAGTTDSLKDVLKVAVLDGTFTGDRAAATALTFDKTLADFLKEGELAAGAEGDAYAVVIYWEPTENDNHYNLNNGAESSDGEALSIELGINLIAAQNIGESDAFGPDYDTDAEYPIVADVHHDAENATGFLAALASAEEGKTTAIHLTEDLVLSEVGNPGDSWLYHAVLEGDKEVIIDLAGKTLEFEDVSQPNFTGGILARGSDVTLVNGTVEVNDCAGIYTTLSSSHSVFRNVTFQVSGGSGSYGVHGVGFTEFKNCTFNVTGGYGIFCSRTTKVEDCTFYVSGFSSVGIQMNNYCVDNVLNNCTFHVSEGTAIYLNNNSNATISNVSVYLTGNKSVTGISASNNSAATLGANITVQSESTAYSQTLFRGSQNFANITLADGVSMEASAEPTHYSSYSQYAGGNGSYWKTVSAAPGE